MQIYIAILTTLTNIVAGTSQAYCQSVHKTPESPQTSQETMATRYRDINKGQVERGYPGASSINHKDAGVPKEKEAKDSEFQRDPQEGDNKDGLSPSERSQ